MMELLTLIGSAGSGKLFGLVGEFLSNRAHEKAEAQEREFQRDLAFKGQLHDYMAAQHKEVDGRPSLIQKTLSFLYILFGVTICVCCVVCFVASIGEVSPVTIKDPDAKGGALSIFGFIDWQFQAKSKTELSMAGLGYLILHPLLFIISMVSTGGSRQK
jgi:hypothetical protein